MFQKKRVSVYGIKLTMKYIGNDIPIFKFLNKFGSYHIKTGKLGNPVQG